MKHFLLLISLLFSFPASLLAQDVEDISFGTHELIGLVAVNASTAFVSTPTGVYAWNAADDTWYPLELPRPAGTTVMNVYSMAHGGGELLVGYRTSDMEGNFGVHTESRVAASSDNGATWTELGMGTRADASSIYNETVFFNGRLFTRNTRNINSALYVSDDKGLNWELLKQNPGTNGTVRGSALLVADGTLYAGNRRSTDGLTFELWNAPFEWKNLAFGNGTYYGFMSHSLHTSSDNGTTWTEHTAWYADRFPIQADRNISPAAAMGDVVLFTNSISLGEVGSNHRNMVSLDGGVSFEEDSDYFAVGSLGQIWLTTQWGHLMTVVSDARGITVYDPSNNRFSTRNRGLPLKTRNVVNQLTWLDDRLVATSNNGVFETFDNGRNWKALPLPPQAFDIGWRHIPGFTHIARVGDNVYAGNTKGYVFRSSDNGLNWQPVLEGTNSNSNNVLRIEGSGSVVFASWPESPLNRSGDNGMTWSEVAPPAGDPETWGFTVLGDSVYVVYASSASGQTRDLYSAHVDLESHADQVPTREMMFSTSSGDHEMVADDAFVYYARTSDRGVRYHPATGAVLAIEPPRIDHMQSLGRTIWGFGERFQTTRRVVFASSQDQGLTWTENTARYDMPEDGRTVEAAYPSGNNLFVSLGGVSGFNGVYRYSLDEADVVSVQSMDGQLPVTMTLHQNYPNPFNPSTVIPFELTESGPVRLRVFNVLGQAVMDVVDGHLAAGTYQVAFDGHSIPSGTYLYRLESAGTSVTRMMTLLK